MIGMTKTTINIAIEKRLLKSLDSYIGGRLDSPSRSSIICDALQNKLYTLIREKQLREGLDISVNQ